jgi:glutathione S-transferase
MLKIYGVPISVHTRKVIVAALEKNLPFENEPVIPFNPPPGWAELSPTGKIPVARDGDLLLRDSSVICAYLERAHPQPALYPAEAADYARALWYEEYADGVVFREVVHGLFFQKIIRPGILKEKTDSAVVDAILNGSLAKVFGYLEEALGADALDGGRFGIADIALASNLINFHYLGYEIERRKHPRLAASFAAWLERPSIRKALAAEQPVAASMGLDSAFVQR